VRIPFADSFQFEAVAGSYRIDAREAGSEKDKIDK